MEPLRLRDRAASVALTALLLGMWVVVVILVVLLLAGVSDEQQAVPTWVVVAAVLLAVATAVPAARWIRPSVDAVLWSHPEDAPQLMSDVGRSLRGAGASVSGADLEAEIAHRIARRLRLPYVAIVAEGAPVESPPELATRLVSIPLVLADEPMGRLIVAPRQRDRTLSEPDRGLLEDLAGQIAIALHAVRSRDALQASRAAVITAREEERRRIRRDLHDGLGPTLASLRLHLAALQQLIPGQPEEAAEVVERLRVEVRGTSGLVRELIYDLGPPLLDELGLVEAIRSRAAELTSPAPLRVTVEMSAGVPELAAAVEVAMFRVACEALTNAARHGGAESVAVRIDLAGEQVRLTVEDDGHGLPAGLVAGVGIAGMRERADELRGTLTLRDRDGASGTVVEARLPLRAIS